MIFPLAKTEEREKLFKFAGVISDNPSFFFKLKTRKDIHINNLEEAKNYYIGVIRQDIRHKFLL